MYRIRTRLALAAALILLMSACGGGDTTEAAAEVEETPTTVADDAMEDEAMEDDAVDGEPAEEAEKKEPVAEEEAEEETAESESEEESSIGDLTDEETSLILASKALKGFSSGQDDTIPFTAEEQACIGGGILAADPALLAVDDFDTLTNEQQTAVFETVIDCAPETTRTEFLEGFEADGGFDDLPIGDDVAPCIYDGLVVDDDERTLRISAFMALGEDEPAPEASIEPGAALFAECIDIGSIMTSVLGDDPELQTAIDTDCLEESFSQENTQSLFEAMLRNPNGGDEDIPEGFDEIFNCLAFGELFASQFAAIGVEMTDAEISCLDDAFSSPEAIAAFSSDDGGDELMGSAFACFTPETFAALSGA